MQNNTKLIREQNDRFRKQLPHIGSVPGRVVITRGIQELTDSDAEPGKHLSRLFQMVREYDDFNIDCDPYAEHDFGVLTFNGQKCFWKVDYYAPDMMHGAEDPSDLS